jgi:hypothetical protein
MYTLLDLHSWYLDVDTNLEWIILITIFDHYIAQRIYSETSALVLGANNGAHELGRYHAESDSCFVLCIAAASVPEKGLVQINM